MFTQAEEGTYTEAGADAPLCGALLLLKNVGALFRGQLSACSGCHERPKSREWSGQGSCPSVSVHG